MRGVAGQREARRDEGAGERQAERPGARLAARRGFRRASGRSAVPVPSSKTRSSPATSRSASSVRSVQTSDERLSVSSGRMAKGPAGRKCSSARPLCGRSCATVQTMPDWPYSHLHGLDAGHVAQLRIDAVGGDQQPRRRASRRRRDAPSTPALSVSKPLHRDAFDDVDAELARRGARSAPFSDVLATIWAKGSPGADLAVEGQEDRAHRIGGARIGDDHLGDRLRPPARSRPRRRAARACGRRRRRSPRRGRPSARRRPAPHRPRRPQGCGRACFSDDRGGQADIAGAGDQHIEPAGLRPPCVPCLRHPCRRLRRRLDLPDRSCWKPP